MKALMKIIPAVILITCCTNPAHDNLSENKELWPPVEPFEKGYIRVSELHELYYERVGNPTGKPAIFLHGGPGGNIWPVMRQLFNPDAWMVVLFDQRGAGKSRPYAEISENNTQALIEDIEKIRVHFGIEQMLLVGGSWGSTLALAYAESYPQRVSGLVLRGIWTATKQEVDHFYHGGCADHYPDAYNEFLLTLPDSSQRPLPEYLFNLLTGEDELLKKRIAGAWLRYEWRISEVNANPAEIDTWLESNNPYAFSLIENYYMANGCFLEEGQLWNNLHLIQNIPTVIINGRFDMPCPVKTAYRLHQALSNSELVIVETAGHGGFEILLAKQEAIRKFENIN